MIKPDLPDIKIYVFENLMNDGVSSKWKPEITYFDIFSGDINVIDFEMFAELY